jgi:hypothetical protein
VGACDSDPLLFGGGSSGVCSRIPGTGQYDEARRVPSAGNLPTCPAFGSTGLSVDPLVNETGTPYAFTDGDPVNESDPSGLSVYLRFDPLAGIEGYANFGRGLLGLNQAFGSSCRASYYIGGAFPAALGLLAGLSPFDEDASTDDDDYPSPSAPIGRTGSSLQVPQGTNVAASVSAVLWTRS